MSKHTHVPSHTWYSNMMQYVVEAVAVSCLVVVFHIGAGHRRVHEIAFGKDPKGSQGFGTYRNYPIPSMGLFYLPTWMVDFDGKCR